VSGIQPAGCLWPRLFAIGVRSTQWWPRAAPSGSLWLHTCACQPPQSTHPTAHSPILRQLESAQQRVEKAQMESRTRRTGFGSGYGEEMYDD
jgi:hypothetical protein